MRSRLPLAGLVLLVAILAPFLIWEDAILAWTSRFTSQPGNAAAVAVTLAGLLALDIVLPIPSSLVSTAAGALLGFLPGTAVSWAGMTVGSWAGYLLGKAAPRWLDLADRERLEKARAKYGDWIVIVFRPVPVLAEASCVFAGASAMPLGRFMLLASLANLGISLAYGAAGAFAASKESFLLAFAGAVTIPAVAMLVLRRVGRRD
jgi:uncharacterized membrane protein YdjX (TVP38/TMEM64 family)